MSSKFGLIGLESIQNRYLDGRPVMNCGQETASEIDKEVMVMLKSSYEEAKRLLSEHREALDKIAAFLIEKETITGKEFMKIFYEVEGIDAEEKKAPEQRVALKLTAPETDTEKKSTDLPADAVPEENADTENEIKAAETTAAEAE